MIRRIFFPSLAAVALLALTRPSHASGKLFADVYAPLNNEFSRPLTQATLSWWQDLDYVPKDEAPWAVRSLLEVVLYEGNSSTVTGSYDTTNTDLNFHEAYLTYGKVNLETRFGIHSIPWGISDVINPTDYLSARDFRRFNPDSEIQRKSSAGVWASWTPEAMAAWNFTACVNPLLARGHFLLAPKVFPSGVSLESSSRPEPEFLEGLEAAFKAVYTGEKWDFSFSGYNGFSHYPEFQEVSSVVFSPVDVRVRLKEVFRRRTGMGSDFSWSGETWVYRAEFAHIWNENRDGSNMTSVPSYLHAVVGAERPFWNDFRMQIQYAHKYHTAYRPIDEITGSSPVDGLIERQIASANATLFQYQEREQGTVTVRLSYLNESSGWDAEVFFMENLRGQDFLVRPKTSYAWSDSLRYTLGADIYGGPGHRSLGALSAYNSVFLEAKYSF